jgi:hypothetical protein
MFSVSLENISTMEKNKEALLESSRETGLEVKTEKTKYTFMSHQQNAGQNTNLRIANKSFKSFKYIVYHSIQNLLSSPPYLITFKD